VIITLLSGVEVSQLAENSKDKSSTTEQKHSGNANNKSVYCLHYRADKKRTGAKANRSEGPLRTLAKEAFYLESATGKILSMVKDANCKML